MIPVASHGPRISSTKFLSLRPHSTLSAVHRGIAFEQRSLKLLQDNFSMSLQRMGGKSDGGIDLMGFWWLPNLGSTSGRSRACFRVIAQCKAHKRALGPTHVREMEGVYYQFKEHSRRFPSTLQKEGPCEGKLDSADQPLSPPQLPMVALLVSESQFTTSSHQRAQSSLVPFLLIHIPLSPSPPDHAGQEENKIGSITWNPALGGTHGLLKGRMELRWERSLRGSVGRPGLWLDGKRWECTPENGDI
jgi:hypothetical protein